MAISYSSVGAQPNTQASLQAKQTPRKTGLISPMGQVSMPGQPSAQTPLKSSETMQRDGSRRVDTYHAPASAQKGVVTLPNGTVVNSDTGQVLYDSAPKPDPQSGMIKRYREAGEQAKETAKRYGAQYANVGRKGFGLMTGQLTTGTSPVASGNAAITAQTTAAQQSAIAQAGNLAQSGINQQLNALSLEEGAAQAGTDAQQDAQQSLQDIATQAINAGATQEQVNQILSARTPEEALGLVAGTGLLGQDAEGGFTLGTGQIRYDAQGNVIARGGAGAGSGGGGITGISSQPLGTQSVPSGTEDVTISRLLNSAGGKQLTATETSDLSQGLGVIKNIQRLSELLSKTDSSDIGPFAGRFNTPYNTNVNEINALITSIVPALARGVYQEVGVLTDTDVDRYTKTLPNTKQTADTNKALVEQNYSVILRSLDTQLNALANSGKDVSGFASDFALLKNNVDKLLGGDTSEGDSNDAYVDGLPL